MDFYVEELKDALLDLKAATIGRDLELVAPCIDEIRAILFKIDSRTLGDE